MFDTVLYTHIRENIFVAGGFEGNFVDGSAERLKPPYIIMLKITDPEQPQTLCDVQGEHGSALIQFSAYCGYKDRGGVDALTTKVYLNSFKDEIKNLRGIIGTTEQYRILYNFTNGVISLNGGASSLRTYGAVFDCTLDWEKV